MTHQTVKVDEGAASQRLDLFLAAQLGISRSQAQALIKQGGVTVNSRPEPARYLLRTGETVDVTQANTAKPQTATHTAPDIPILFENSDLIVIDKPAGLVTHPGAGVTGPTVADFARLHTSDPDPDRPGIVHRLDKDTSGVMVIAKNPDAKQRLQAAFANREVHKTYFALLTGQIKPDEAVINLPLGRSRTNPLAQDVRAGGRPAVTQYKLLASYPGYSLVEAHPQTGRTHQLRLHFRAVGHPIVGDQTYGVKGHLQLGRQFLHAAAISIPFGQAPIVVSSPLPADLRNCLTQISQK